MTDPELEALLKATEGHTAGPWLWTVSPKNFAVELSRGGVGEIVMGFDRWGMGGATPRFRVDGLMKRAVDLSVPQPGREHHATWWRLIDHPDARLIAAAPTLRAEVVRLRAISPRRLECNCGLDAAIKENSP